MGYLSCDEVIEKRKELFSLDNGDAFCIAVAFLGQKNVLGKVHLRRGLLQNNAIFDRQWIGALSGWRMDNVVAVLGYGPEKDGEEGPDK